MRQHYNRLAPVRKAHEQQTRRNGRFTPYPLNATPRHPYKPSRRNQGGIL